MDSNGGPPDRSVLHAPDAIAGMVSTLDLERAAEVQRVVTTDDGERTAIDSRVIARRRS